MSLPPWQVNFPQNIGPNRRIEQNQEPSIFNEQLENGLEGALDTVFPDFFKDNYENEWNHNDSQVITSGVEAAILWNNTDMTGRTAAVQPHFTQSGSTLTCTRTGVYRVTANVYGSHTGGAITEFNAFIRLVVGGSNQAKQTFLFKSGDPGFSVTWTGAIASTQTVVVNVEQSTGTNYTCVNGATSISIMRIE